MDGRVVGGLAAGILLSLGGQAWAQHGPPNTYQSAPVKSAPPAMAPAPAPAPVAPGDGSDSAQAASAAPGGVVSNQPIPDTAENRAKYTPLSNAGKRSKPKGS